jgi:hypothetical protein
MITTNIPRKKGLDAVVLNILGSKQPLINLASELGVFFHPEDLIRFRAGDFPDACELVYALVDDEAVFGPFLRDALSYLRQGRDYIGEDRAEIRRAFWLGDQTYHFVDVKADAFNPNFALSLFPEETTTIDEKKGLMDEFTDPRFPKNYEHVKTLLLYDGNSYYLAVVPGNQRVNTKAVKRQLGIPKKKDLRIASVNPEEIVGREPGCVSPFIQKDHFPNISKILFAKELLEPYSQLHYSFPIDRRSAVVVSDVNDLIDTLREVEGFPKIEVYENEKSKIR